MRCYKGNVCDVYFSFTFCDNTPYTVFCVNVYDIVNNVILYVLGKARTLNPQIRSLILYPIELQALVVLYIFFNPMATSFLTTLT